MSAEYSKDDLPPAVVEVNGKEWRREEFDTHSYHWIRPMEDDEYDWDAEEDKVSLVGTDVPIRVVAIQYDAGSWEVTASETAGPKYHRPGFTELISGEYTATFDNPDKAFETVQTYIRKLS